MFNVAHNLYKHIQIFYRKIIFNDTFCALPAFLNCFSKLLKLYSNYSQYWLFFKSKIKCKNRFILNMECLSLLVLDFVFFYIYFCTNSLKLLTTQFKIDYFWFVFGASLLKMF